MAHKTLIGGTAYNISGGKSMVRGTAYNITKGKTLVGGTGYDIRVGGGEATAMLYNTGDFAFQRGSDVEEGKTLSASYTGFEGTSYSQYSNVPWNSQRANIKNVYCNEEISPTSMAYWFYNCRNLSSFNAINFDLNSVTIMTSVYQNCYNLIGSPFCGNNVTIMLNTYYNCSNLTGSPVCGNNVTNMVFAYYNCRNLTGSPVCRNNVTNMSYTYYNCFNITGSPVCGNNIMDMLYTYCNCRNLTGSPVCSNKVVSMMNAYYNCRNLTGSPVCGSNVTSMYGTYYNCFNLTGSPVCGAKVTSMVDTYCNCFNLTGIAICGNRVSNAVNAYYGCKNIRANAYFYSSTISNVRNCFKAKSNTKILNIYVPSGSKTNTTVHRTNTTSLVGANITWTDAGIYQYNTKYNIYIYPVANVAAAAIANGDEEANANAGITTGTNVPVHQ